ncbi:polysaccharide deacetylase family protein [uncultured Pontibacter sp.]|uniref:polysaccharide deacetylase family protein n=1 Tax=uncultured Pontibacter sp. TaxID=453356 RepID=UPI0026315304|nr:polysaccharide deacetylase family protein [uncultured Pontibacter sp.]
MKKNLRALFGNFHTYTSIGMLLRLTQQNILLPFYHSISDHHLAHISNLYQMRSSSLFIKDLEFYLQHYKPISLHELNQLVASGEKPAKPVFHVTFDDGLRELYTVVAPILEQKGIPATIFINTGFIDNTQLFYRYKVSLLVEALQSIKSTQAQKQLADTLGIKPAGKEAIKLQLLQLGYNDQATIHMVANLLEVDFDAYLKEKQPYLTSPEIKRLMAKGFTFGSHSIDHPHFNSISFDEQKRQVNQSFETMKTLLGIRDKYFSFPFGDDGVSLEFMRWLQEEANCSLTFGISGFKSDFSPTHLHRIPMEGTLKEADNLVKSEYLYYMAKAAVKKNTIQRK